MQNHSNSKITFLSGFLILVHFVMTVVVCAKVGDHEKARLKEYVARYWEYQTDSVNQRFVDDIQVLSSLISTCFVT